ncbi:IS200/IS605 family transposase [Chitinophaga eiseniae]|uniref:IS200/IS605 family transposase n=1 Tax=Chitinophaga eiseniae TaxID=634771 RepID=UPI0009999F36|nr:IS200/IS605 family transposase [Chitinophaga eiseniae]
MKYRAALISSSFKSDLYKYMAAAINRRSHLCLIINGMPDHVHIFVRMHPAESLSSLVQIIKGSSSKWINHYYPSPQPFRWQEGYGAFSYSKSQIPGVVQYIKNQEQHHRHQSFLAAYQNMLNKYDIIPDASNPLRRPC